MSFHIDLNAFVFIRLHSDAFKAHDAIHKIKVPGVEVHEVHILFGETDLIAKVHADCQGEGREQASRKIAQWVNALRQMDFVESTRTAIVVSSEIVAGAKGKKKP